MKKNKWTFLSLAILCLIFWFSSQNASTSSAQSGFFLQYLPFLSSFILRKMAHMSLYASLSFCIIQSLKKEHIPSTLLICFLYACSDELHQLLIPGRSGEFRDVCFDFIGSCIGLVFFYLLKKSRQSCSKKLN